MGMATNCKLFLRPAANPVGFGQERGVGDAPLRSSSAVPHVTEQMVHPVTNPDVGRCTSTSLRAGGAATPEAITTHVTNYTCGAGGGGGCRVSPPNRRRARAQCRDLRSWRLFLTDCFRPCFIFSRQCSGIRNFPSCATKSPRSQA